MKLIDMLSGTLRRLTIHFVFAPNAILFGWLCAVFRSSIAPNQQNTAATAAKVRKVRNGGGEGRKTNLMLSNDVFYCILCMFRSKVNLIQSSHLSLPRSLSRLNQQSSMRARSMQSFVRARSMEIARVSQVTLWWLDTQISI